MPQEPESRPVLLEPITTSELQRIQERVRETGQPMSAREWERLQIRPRTIETLT